MIRLVNFIIVWIQINTILTEPANKDDLPEGWIEMRIRKNNDKLFKKFAVVADSRLCSKQGGNIIRSGGNAADALVTTHCCTEVVSPNSAGVGGGGYAVYYDKNTGKSKSFDFREILPQNYDQRQRWSQGGKILVPGVLKGLYMLWQEYGSRKLSWAALWQPCIEIARRGVKISPSLNNAILRQVEAYFTAPSILKTTFSKGRRVLRKGQIIKRPLLAKTFQRIAESGSDEVFYRGSMGMELVRDVQESGGVISVQDLYHYNVRVGEATSVNIKNMTMFSVPAPAGGPLISLILKILENFKWRSMDDFKDDPALMHHYLIEAFKYAYAPNTFIRDPAYERYESRISSYMLDPGVARTKQQRIDRTSHEPDHYKPYNDRPVAESHGTTHISIVDAQGNAVSCSTSLNGNFGSGIMSKRLGVIFNDQAKEFNKPWRKLYNIQEDVKIPGKRPTSRMSPVIFVDRKKRVAGVFGAAGGNYIPTSIAQTITNWLFLGMSLKKATTLPRLHCQLFPRKVTVEKDFPNWLIERIKVYQKEPFTNESIRIGKESNPKKPDRIMGVVAAIVRLPKGGLNAHGDYRKDGIPDGE